MQIKRLGNAKPLPQSLNLCAEVQQPLDGALSMARSFKSVHLGDELLVLAKKAPVATRRLPQSGEELLPIRGL